ncbi:radical SAM protein [Mesorhizobium cantuariense]|uniref:Radical SAM/SPASM domain-containing protein n=1 Tax=Mesorhizobium cantuariense TaxID=1300275 RepID=A0ABV7MJ06_9HYPH
MEPTTRCNFTCGFCVGRHMHQLDLELSTSVRVFELFPNIEAIELQGEGEPLLNRDFFDIADGAARLGAKISLITNGSLMSPARVEQILKRPVERIGFSLESPDDAKFEQIRGGSFPKVIEGIRRLKQARDTEGLKLPVIGLNVTVLKSTLDQLDSIVALYRELGLDGGISFQGLQEMPSYSDCYSEQLTGEILSQNEKRTLGQFLVRFLSNATINKSGSNVGFYARLFAELPTRPNTCPWLSKAGYVSAEGEMMPCCHIKNTEWSFGNVEETDRETLIGRRDAMGSQLANGIVPKPCVGCWVLPFLSQAFAHSSTEDRTNSR